MTAPVSVDAVIDKAVSVLTPVRPDGAAEIIRVRQVPPGRPTIVVVGETKRGKSSLINALVNVPGLSPVDAQVATSTYLTIQYGAQPAARAVFPGSPSPVPIELNRLRDWATGLGQLPEGQVAPRMIEIDCPSPLLQNLSLVDTPGVGGLESVHGEIALRAAGQATALLFVVDASAPFTSHELDFLRKASESVDLVMFAVTKIDAYRGWRQIVEDDKALLKEHAPRFADAELLPVSSRLFEQAAALPTPELAGVLRTESQVIALQLTLQRKVAARGTALHQANVLRSARTQLAGHYRDLALRKSAVDPDPAKVVELRAEREKLVASRRSESRTWQLKLRAEIARARMDSMHDVQREVRDGLHNWRTAIDRADKETMARLPQDIDAALHATSLRIFDRLAGRLRVVTDTVLRDMFAPDELEEVYAGLTRTQLPEPVAPPEKRSATMEDKIVVYGGVATGLAAGRMIAYLPALVGVGVASVVVAPISIGIGLVATTWMVRSRKHVAEKNHVKLWVSETLTEARATMEAEVASQFIDAEHALTLALDAALQRRIEALDGEIREIDDALRLDAQEKDKRRKELIAQQSVVRGVVAQIDGLLPGLRAGSGPALPTGAVAMGGGSR